MQSISRKIILFLFFLVFSVRSLFAEQISQVLRFPVLYLALPVVLAFIGLMFGIFLVRIDSRRVKMYGLIIIVFSVLGFLIFFPFMLMEKIVITDERIYDTVPFKNEPGNEIRFRHVDHIRIKSETDEDLQRTVNRRLDTQVQIKKPVWEIHYKNGETGDMHSGDLWNLHSEKIIRALSSHGIDVK